MKKIRDAYKILVRIPPGKRPFGRPGCRSEYNIKMGLRSRLSKGQLDSAASR
jgi:hypothetical protein